MRRLAFGLVLSLVAASPALADGWRRVSAGGDTFWVSASDLDRAQAGARGRIRILDLDPPPGRDGEALGYRIIDRTYDCASGGSEDLVVPYGPRGERRDDYPMEEMEAREADGLFQIVCEGASPYDDVELESVRDVIAWEARNGGAGGPGNWEPGGGSGLFDEGYEGPDREDEDFEPSPQEFDEPAESPYGAQAEDDPAAWEPPSA